MDDWKKQGPCIQTLCCWFVELAKRGNITQTKLFSLPREIQNRHRLWWTFNCQYKSFSVRSVPFSVLIVQGTDSRCNLVQCNNRLDGISVFVCFRGRTTVQQHYKNIAIEYGHFHLKITGVSRPNTCCSFGRTLSQRESSPSIELYL